MAPSSCPSNEMEPNEEEEEEEKSGGETSTLVVGSLEPATRGGDFWAAASPAISATCPSFLFFAEATRSKREKREDMSGQKGGVVVHDGVSTVVVPLQRR